jgi:hypothetical protein
MSDKVNHSARLNSDDRSSSGFSRISIQCEGGKPETAEVYFSTHRTYISRDFGRYAYRLDKEEVVSGRARVTQDSTGLLIARGSDAVGLTKKFLNVSSISSSVINYDGRSYEGNFDNVQQNKDSIQKLMNACEMN